MSGWRNCGSILLGRPAAFPGLILGRAVLLAAFCGTAGLLVWRRTGHYYRALVTALVAGTIASAFAMDRPFVFTFLFLAVTAAILESRRGLWILPPLFVVWANCHGGYFMGWVVLGAYSAEALFLWWRKKPQPGKPSALDRLRRRGAGVRVESRAASGSCASSAFTAAAI